MDNLLASVKAIDLRMVMADLGFTFIQNRRMKCPFHEDDSPSLHVYPPPQNEFHCFGCNKHGDTINFYAEINGLDFKTALERLAYTYIPNYDVSGMKAFKNQPKQIVYTKKDPAASYIYKEIHSDIYEDFQRFCLNYKPTESTVKAANYLRNRGLDDWTIRHFKLFTIKNYHETNQFLKDKYNEADLISSGLMNEKGNLIFYVHPIIFPYYQKKRIIYLQGRTIGEPKDGASKYQFLKGVQRPLFNQDILAITRTNSEVYITEGAIDCMTLFQQGMPAISLGSAKHFRKEWSKLFQRFNMVVWFDNDNAGQQGTIDLMETLYLNGISVERKYLPTGIKDINELFNKKTE